MSKKQDEPSGPVTPPLGHLLTRLGLPAAAGAPALAVGLPLRGQ